MEKHKLNPLNIMWNIFSTVSGVVSIASFAEDVIQWKSFIQYLVSAYQGFVYPIFSAMFSWLPFSLPHYCYDYLVFGLIVSSSYIKTVIVMNRIMSTWRGDPLEEVMLSALARLFCWPAYIVYYLVKLKLNVDEDEIYRKKREFCIAHPIRKMGVDDDDWVDEPMEQRERRAIKYAQHTIAMEKEPLIFSQWLGAIVLGVVLLVAINRVL